MIFAPYRGFYKTSSLTFNAVVVEAVEVTEAPAPNLTATLVAVTTHQECSGTTSRLGESPVPLRGTGTPGSNCGAVA